MVEESLLPLLEFHTNCRSLDDVRKVREMVLAKLCKIDETLADDPTAPSVVSFEAGVEECRGHTLRFLCGDWMMPGAIGMISGDSGTGKTVLAAQLAVGLATGRGVINWRIENRTPVLLASVEGPRHFLMDRCQKILKHTGWDHFPSNMWFHSKTIRDFRIGEPGLERMIQQSRAEVVFLDTLQHFFTGDENSAEEWKNKCLIPLSRLRDRYGTTFILIHHHNKAAESWKAIRGSSAIYSDLDFVIQLRKESEEEEERLVFDGSPVFNRIVEVAKNKYGPRMVEIDHVDFSKPFFYRGKATRGVSL